MTPDQYLQDDLARVESLIEESLQVEGELMQQVADYIGQSKGKRIRPTLVCLSARGAGNGSDSSNFVAVAASVELLHTATLLHDDVIDHAPLRRGRPTVNAKWGDDVAILMADFMYAAAFDLVLSILDPEALRMITRVTRAMTVGEMFQIETRGEWLRVKDYLRIIENKTAGLFGACSGLGALTGGAPRKMVEEYVAFGLNFGMAFQLTDDALDYSAQGERWGKRVGSDISEGKQTLPLLHTLHKAASTDREQLLACLNNGRDFETIHRYVTAYRGVEAARDLARKYGQKAIGHLEHLGRGEALENLRTLAHEVAERQY